MNNQLKPNFEYKKTVTVLFVITLLFGAMSVLFDIVAFPFIAAWFAALFLFSVSRRYGVILSCVAAAITITLGFLASPLAAFTVMAALVTGLIIGFSFLMSRSKPECVTVALITLIAITVGALWIYAALHGEGADIGSVRDFYTGLYSDFRAAFISAMNESYATLGAGTSENNMAAINELMPGYLDRIAYHIPALIAIAAFILVGVACKIFVRLVYKYSARGGAVLRWRFTTTNIFVYFYIALLILSFFVSGKDAFSLSVANFYTLFNFIYAYIGYNFVTALLAQRMKYGLAVLIVIAAVLLFSSFAMGILAVAGVVFTLVSNKAGGFGALPDDVLYEQKTDDESENDNEKD